MTFGFNPNKSILAGLTQQQLQTMLAAAQNAYAALMTGQQAVTIVVTGGGQHREVSYQRADTGALVQWINLLQAQLGLRRTARRPFGVSF